MVVDDTIANLHLLIKFLTQQGYAVRPVVSGAVALEIAEAVAPDLILLDINLPDIRGYTVCTRLKANPRTRDIPVIFLSALDDVADKVQAFKVGGVDYITKPFHFEEVMVRVQTHLLLRRLQRQMQQQNIELAAKNAQLAAQNAELDAFAHTVAHDLKNPLLIMIGYSELLETDFATMTPDAIQEILQLISRTGYRLSDIVNALLLLASVRQIEDAPRLPLDMTAIVAEALATQETVVAQTGATVTLPDHWPTALGYAPWVQEIWSNYLNNALKYGGQPPHITLGATPFDVDGQPYIRFWIRDNGHGLTAAEQAQLFTAFTRLHRERASGHGLGLSIVRRIVEKLGGEVHVTSALGQGSVFAFTLPAAPPDALNLFDFDTAPSALYWVTADALVH